MRATRILALLSLVLAFPVFGSGGDLFTDAGPLPRTAQLETPAHRARAVNVSFDAFPEAASAHGAAIAFNLFDDTLLTGRVEEVLLTDRSLVLSGTLADEPEATFIAVRCQDALVAEVRSPTRGLFEIRPLPGGTHAVRRVNESKFQPCALGPEHEIPHAGDPVPPAAGTRQNTDITVAVFYTAQARAGAGGQAGIDGIIDLAITQANQVYAGSQVEVTLQLAYRGLVNYTESGDAGSDLSRFRNTSDGIMDEVHAIRNCVKADMAALLVNNFNACGIGYLMQGVGPNFASSAFTVTDKDCVSNYSFAHELGHNMGCHHDRDNASSGAYSYSYGYRTTDGVYRTVMAYAPGQRIGYFSNPNITYQGRVLGVPIGQPTEAHNAQTINNTKATVAAFRTGFQPADYNQDGFVDGIDSDQFNNAFEAGDIAADFNGDGFVDGIDYDQFHNAFENGC